MSIGVIVNGITYMFDNPTYGYVTAADGFGMPAIDRFLQRGAQQHGSSNLGYRLNARRVSLVIELPVDTEINFYEARARLLSLFHPANAVAIKVTDGAALDRRLDVVFENSMDMPLDNEWKVQKVVISMITSGLSAWYDATARSALIDTGNGANTFIVPMPVPHGVGSNVVNANAVIEYRGTWEEYPRVKITGPVTNCVIVNNSTGDKLDFTGYTLLVGHYIEIDTAYGKKTVLYDGAINYLDKLTADSNLATFSIAPVQAGEVVHENSIHVSGTAASDTTKVEVFWNDRYIGL